MVFKYRQEHNTLSFKIHCLIHLSVSVVLSVVIPGKTICYQMNHLFCCKKNNYISLLNQCYVTKLRRKKKNGLGITLQNLTVHGYVNVHGHQPVDGSSPLMTFALPQLGFVTRDLGVGVSSDCMMEPSPTQTRMADSVVKSSSIPNAQHKTASLQPISLYIDHLPIVT